MTLPLRRGLPTIALCFAAMIGAVLAAPFIGSTSIQFSRVFSRSIPFADNIDAQIFFIARLPRALAAALVGGTLAAAGVVFQGLLRNALATPYTLGVSAGASLGAMIAITFGSAWAVGGVAGITGRELGVITGRVLCIATGGVAGITGRTSGVAGR